MLAIKTAKLGDYNGKTLSTLFTSVLTVDPDLDEARTLRAWSVGAGRTLMHADLPQFTPIRPDSPRFTRVHSDEARALHALWVRDVLGLSLSMKLDDQVSGGWGGSQVKARTGGEPG